MSCFVRSLQELNDQIISEVRSIVGLHYKFIFYIYCGALLIQSSKYSIVHKKLMALYLTANNVNKVEWKSLCYRYLFVSSFPAPFVFPLGLSSLYRFASWQLLIQRCEESNIDKTTQNIPFQHSFSATCEHWYITVPKCWKFWELQVQDYQLSSVNSQVETV